MIEKRITLADQAKMHPSFAAYYRGQLESNEASPVFGLPARRWTEVLKDPFSGDVIVRYEPKERSSKETQAPHMTINHIGKNAEAKLIAHEIGWDYRESPGENIAAFVLVIVLTGIIALGLFLV